MAKLKAAILAAQTLGELHALMEDYSYMEFMQIYNQLTPEQQAKLHAIDERDSKAQMLAIKIAQAPVAEGKQLLPLTASVRNHSTKNGHAEMARLSAQAKSIEVLLPLNHVRNK
jgi:hypothetical protein